jgi:hypothetical protein
VAFAALTVSPDPPAGLQLLDIESGVADPGRRRELRIDPGYRLQYQLTDDADVFGVHSSSPSAHVF